MFVEVDGFHIAFSDIGHGEPVVLLPGKFMTRQRWFEVGIAESLAEEFRVLAIDPLGFGESSKPHSPDDYSSAVVAGGIAAVLDDREVDAARLWGYSLGAQTAVDFADHHAERVHSLVLGGNPVLPRSALPPDPASLEALRAGDWARFWELFPITIPAETMQAMERSNDPVAQASFEEGVRDDVLIEDIDCPKMFYVGGGEWFWEAVRDVARRTDSRFERIGELGHAETFQSPWLVLPGVRDFLQSH